MKLINNLKEKYEIYKEEHKTKKDLQEEIRELNETNLRMFGLNTDLARELKECKAKLKKALEKSKGVAKNARKINKEKVKEK